MTGKGPGKFPDALFCSAQNVRMALIPPDIQALLPLAVRILPESVLIASVCNKMAVGSDGSGMTISGETVNFPEGDARDSNIRPRVSDAASLDNDNA